MATLRQSILQIWLESIKVPVADTRIMHMTTKITSIMKARIL